jgi:hypothetical protein
MVRVTIPVDNAAAEPLDLWLWPEGDAVRWWSGEETRLLRLAAPSPIPDQSTLEALCDGRAELALGAALAEELGDALASLLNRRARVRLHLDADLPGPWHALAFEWLQDGGQTLHARLSVVRYWVDDPVAIASISRHRQTVVLNLMPAGDPVQPVRGLGGEGVQIIDGPEMTAHFLARSDLTELGALCVVAHGTRDAAGAPFRLPDGRPWSLPTARDLPPLVILLACSSHDGNLLHEARRLLDAEARTVIAPLGDPSAEGVRAFLRGFLPRWRRGERVDDILCALAAEPNGEARRLLLVGRGELRLDDTPCLEERADEALAALAKDGDGTALRVLVERLTRRCALAGQDIDEAEAELRRLYGMGPYDEAGERCLLAQLSTLQARLSPLTRAWVLPMLAAFAAAYDRPLMGLFEAERAGLECQCVPVTAPILQAWSKAHARAGRFALALADIARGLTLLDRPEPCARTAELWGQLSALLNQLDLPYAAKAVATDLADSLSHRRDAAARRDAFFLLDRRARIELRLGHPWCALSLYRTKRAEAPGFGQSGARELSCLLYVSAWLEPRTPDEAAEWAAWAREAAAMVDADRAGEPAPGGGRYPLPYLLRALALRAWRAGDPQAAECVLEQTGPLRQQLFAGTASDPGPPGLSFAYLWLAARDGVIAAPPIPTWDEIRPQLELHGDFIELAALSYLLRRGADTAYYLDRFDAQRTLPPNVTLPAWLHDGLLTDWEALVQPRAEHERAVLCDTGAPDVARLVASGLLPL